VTKPATQQEAAELVRAALLNLGRASAKLHQTDARGGSPPEYYAINRAWIALDQVAKDLNKKALGR
jgi:hypothetical protein